MRARLPVGGWRAPCQATAAALPTTVGASHHLLPLTLARARTQWWSGVVASQQLATQHPRWLGSSAAAGRAACCCRAAAPGPVAVLCRRFVSALHVGGPPTDQGPESGIDSSGSSRLRSDGTQDDVVAALLAERKQRQAKNMLRVYQKRHEDVLAHSQGAVDLLDSQRAVRWSIAGAAVVFVGKACVVMHCGGLGVASDSIVAETAHSFVDALNQCFLLVGIQRSMRPRACLAPPSALRPCTHAGRYELVRAADVAVLTMRAQRL
jgi:hypothetical protein